MSDPICYFEFHNHQRVQINALETSRCHGLSITQQLERQDFGLVKLDRRKESSNEQP